MSETYYKKLLSVYILEFFDCIAQEAGSDFRDSYDAFLIAQKISTRIDDRTSEQLYDCLEFIKEYGKSHFYEWFAHNKNVFIEINILAVKLGLEVKQITRTQLIDYSDVNDDV